MEDFSKREKRALRAMMRHEGWKVLSSFLVDRQNSLAKRLSMDLGSDNVEEQPLITAGRVKEIGVLLELPSVLVGELEEEQEPIEEEIDNGS